MCEQCGEIFLNLNALDFCIDIEKNMNTLMQEYQTKYAHPSWIKKEATINTQDRIRPGIEEISEKEDEKWVEILF